MKTKVKTGQIVRSAVGKRRLDKSGSAIGAARMNPDKAYGAIPILLKEYIDTASENSWHEIRLRIENVYESLNQAMEALDAAEPFSENVKQALESGKKLFFKPNLVILPAIDLQTHSPVLYGRCLPWEFLAPLMRWFHDKRGISYHQMAVGEAGSATSLVAADAARAWGIEKVTTQAVMEGKYGQNYGGWGFYFARKYLAECHDAGHTDDPMNGYEESLMGVCLPPGHVHDKLLIYDLNKIADDYSNGRDVPVNDGINYQSITIHKAIIGGDPSDPEDVRNWPGCFLVNTAKLKIHIMELFTGAIKNLGIGLYPLEANASREPGKYQWKYALPHLQVPMFKMGLPHCRWIVQTDTETGAPTRDKDGNYLWTRTGGMEATMADIIQAVRGQGVPMIHVVDAIEAINIHHCGPGCTRVPEGLIFASNDMVALDTCASRYLFTMVPMAEVNKIRQEFNLTSDVIQKVPLPKIEGKNIVNGEGYDSPFSRYSVLKHCEDRGIGRQGFYVVGKDLWRGGSLASLDQHLGRVDGGVFTELLTTTLYHTPNKLLWDLQATILAYLELNDQMTGSNFKQKIIGTFDENGDGIIDYREKGRSESPLMTSYTGVLSTQNISLLEALKLRFLIAAGQLKRIRKEWNSDGHNIGEPAILMQALERAFSMSKQEKELPDLFYLGRTWGKGKWPSLQLAVHRQIAAWIYGMGFPNRFDLSSSPYGLAFNYADVRWNRASYTDALNNSTNIDIIGDYHRAVAGGADPLPFTFYMPRGFGTLGTAPIPNVEETDDPQLIFTASFNSDEETWQELHLSSFHLL